MLDIRFIREYPELVKEKSRQKGYEVDIDQLLGFDKEKKSLLIKLEEMRKQRNLLTESYKGKAPSEDEIADGRELKEKIVDLEHQYNSIEKEYITLLRKVPNMPTTDVPVGSSEDQNVVSKEWGNKSTFHFEPRTHWQIAESRGLIDKERAAKVAGSRFAYIKGDLARLQLAIIQFTVDTLTDTNQLQKIILDAGLNVSPKPFELVLPPAMLRTEVFEAMDRLEPRDDRYKVGEISDNLWMQGSAEHTIGPMYIDEVIKHNNLPIRYLGYATSFRREAGSYGKDTQGLIRMHQFDKLEMESFSSSEQGLQEHYLFVFIQEYLMQELGLPYRAITKCTADIGKPNARGIDLEVWLPGHNRYLETHTADYMTDYQARRLNTKYQSDNQNYYMHMNDGTAFALGRTMAGIIENYQREDGTVSIPDVLQAYMKGQTTL